MRKFFRSLPFPFLGMYWLATRPSLLRRAAIPLTLNVVFFGVVGYFVFSQMSELARWVPFGSGQYGSFIMVVAWAIVGLIFGAFVFLTFGLVANVFSAPFHEGLSQEVERLLDAEEGKEGEALPSTGLAVSMGGELSKLLLLALIAGPMALATFIFPLLGPVLYTFLAWYGGMEFVDIASSRHASGFFSRLGFLFRRPLALFGFGLTATMLLAIPVVNLAALPGCVVGATLLYRRVLREP